MRLLIVTQAVDERDGVLGFFSRWIVEFAKNAEKVTVICLREGEYHLPENVKVYSLGKERGGNRAAYVARFLLRIWKLRSTYDTVFVHMNPEYVILGAPLWRVLGKRIGLWYTHKQVDFKLRLATLFADKVFTASKESFRIQSNKVIVMGHGIDTHAYTLPRVPRVTDGPIRILTTGRISKTKGLHQMIKVLDTLHARGRSFTFTIAGSPATPTDEQYAVELRREVSERPYASEVHFLGDVPHADIPKLLSCADVFINLSATGSLDKAVLEAMAAQVPVVTSNEAFRSILPQGTVPADDSIAIAEAIEKAVSWDTQSLKELVEKEHSLPALISRIVHSYD